MTGRDAGGGELFSLSFAMSEVADAEGRSSFVFAVPVRPGWENLAGIVCPAPMAKLPSTAIQTCPWPSCAMSVPGRCGPSCGTRRRRPRPRWPRTRLREDARRRIARCSSAAGFRAYRRGGDEDGGSTTRRRDNAEGGASSYLSAGSGLVLPYGGQPGALTMTGASRLMIDVDAGDQSQEWAAYESGTGTTMQTFAYKVVGRTSRPRGSRCRRTRCRRPAAQFGRWQRGETPASRRWVSVTKCCSATGFLAWLFPSAKP